MRILQLSQFGTPTGGAEGYITDVSRALLAAGHETRLVCFQPGDPADLMPGTVCVPVSPEHPLETTLASLEAIIREYNPDVAYLHLMYSNDVLGWVSERLPVLAYVHGPYVTCPGMAQYLRRSARVCPRSGNWGCLYYAQTERCCFGRSPMRHIERVIAARGSTAVYRKIRSAVGSAYMRELMVRNGIPRDQLEILTPVLMDGPFAVYSPAPEPHTFLFAGRILPEKGIGVLLEAAAGLTGDWRLVIAGDGPKMETWQDQITALRIADRVSFAGRQAGAGMDRLYRQCGFTVVPSLWPEPFGHVGPEAFARGRPVVAFATGGIPDWLQDGVNGILVEPGSVEKLRTALSTMLQSPALQDDLGRQALDIANTAWSSQEHVDRLIEMLKRSRAAFHPR